MLPTIIRKIKGAAKEPGVYVFYKNQIPLYIGKASNLKNRLQNYLKVTDLKTEALHRETDNLKIIPLRSNIEALITESRLIKKLKPRYNILWKDDKNYFYVAVTKEKFPKIFITHQPLNQRITNKLRINEFVNSKQIRYSLMDYIGPFTDGGAIKAVLRPLRRFFPYCTHSPHFRICLDAQINNCPGYCCNKQITTTKQQTADYKKNINRIKNILTGKDKKFIRKLKDPYELLVLEKIWEHEPYLNQRIANPLRINEFVNSKPIRYSLMEHIKSAECYDNSHLSGKEAVGAMTAWKKENSAWVAEKSLWRKFKIRGNYTEDDPRMMEEIVSRRLNHSEWLYPDLIIIDGGITQFNAAKKAISKFPVSGFKFQVISFAKPNQLVFGLEKNPVPISKLLPETQKIIKTAIQNTHNFAVRYHRKTRGNKFLKNK